MSGMAEVMPEIPKWYQTYLAAMARMGEMPSRPMRELEGLCQQTVKEAELDPCLDPRIVRKIQSKYALSYATLPVTSQTRRTLRTLMEAIPPVMHHCDKCCKARLAMDKLQPWEAFKCGSGLAYFPEKSCDSPPDEPHDWLYSGSRIGQQAPNSELDVLALAAESLSNEEQRQTSEAGRPARQKMGLGVQNPEITKHRRTARPGVSDVEWSGNRSLARRHSGSFSAQSHSRGSLASEQPVKPLSTGLSTDLAGLELSNAPDAGIFEGQQVSPVRRQSSNTRVLSKSGPGDLHVVDPHTPARQDRIAGPYTPLSSMRDHPSWNPSDGFQTPNHPSSDMPQTLSGVSDMSLSLDSTYAKLMAGVTDRPLVSALGRSVSDPHVLQRELAKGLQPSEEDEPVKLATAAAVLRAGVDSTAYTPGRPLSRAISDPHKIQQPWGHSPAEAAARALGIYLPPKATLVEWQAVVRFTAPIKDLDLFTVVAALPAKIANTLPGVIPLSGIRPRDAIRMDTILDQPLLLRLGKIGADQTHAVEQMERSKIAVFAEFPTFDFVLVPHLNTRECLHVIGLRMQKSQDIPKAQLPVSVMPLQRTVSAIPALDVEMTTKDRSRNILGKRAPHNPALDSIPEDANLEQEA